MVCSFTTLMPSSLRKSDSIQAGPWLSLRVRANDQRTASAVTGSPLWKRAFSTRWKVHVLASGETSQRSASQGTISGGLPTYFTSASYSACCIIRIDQSYFTLGSMVGTSWRPAKTRIFLSPTRSKAGAVAAKSVVMRLRVSRPAVKDRRVFMSASDDGGRITYARDGLAPPRVRRRDRIAGDRRLDSRHRRRGQPLPGPAQHARALSTGRRGLADGSDGAGRRRPRCRGLQHGR